MINNLRRIRRDKDVTQEKLAEAIGTAQCNISQWERGVCLPNIYCVLAMCKVLNCKPEELFKVEGDDEL